MTLRDWTDPRDRRHWTLWLERGAAAGVLAFASGSETYSVVVNFTDGLEGRSDRDLERLLDEARGA